MKTKTCIKCGAVHEYETDEDLKKHFYLKKTHTGDYFLNTCILCERIKKKEKYDKGIYNYRSKKQYDYFSGVRFFSSSERSWDE
jgi:hypothetical protein